MKFPLVQRRSLWWPTTAGWICLILFLSGCLALWWFNAESFLCLTQRQPQAEVLVVEDWIGLDGILAAKIEFERGGYRYLVSAGGLSNSRWERQQWNYAHAGQLELIRHGFPGDKILLATAGPTDSQRTFATAVAAWQAIRSANIRPVGINVFTLGAHARRSRLIFAKVFGPNTKVGVVSWIPPEYASEPWWRSSERAEDLIKETVGYLFEALLNSGRASNSPAAPAVGKS